MATRSRNSPSCVTIRTVPGYFASSSASQDCARGVEVVRRLVEQDVVRAPHEHLRQRDAHLPAAAEVAAELVVVGRREAQPVEHAADAPVDAVAVEVVEVVEQLALLLDERIEVAVAALDARRDFVQALVDGARLREGRPQLVDERARRRRGRPPAAGSRASRPVAAAPASGSSSPARSLRIVDLPAPFGPTSPARSPSPTMKVTSSSTESGPNERAMDSAKSMVYSGYETEVIRAKCSPGPPSCAEQSVAPIPSVQGRDLAPG